MGDAVAAAARAELLILKHQVLVPHQAMFARSETVRRDLRLDLNLECGPGSSVPGMRVHRITGQLTVGISAIYDGVSRR